MARPLNKSCYDEAADWADLGAPYGFGTASNRPFRDGNKRTALLAMATFLGLNDIPLEADQTDVVTTMLHLASGNLPEAELSDWQREQIGS